MKDAFIIFGTDDVDNDDTIVLLMDCDDDPNTQVISFDDTRVIITSSQSLIERLSDCEDALGECT